MSLPRSACRWSPSSAPPTRRQPDRQASVDDAIVFARRNFQGLRTACQRLREARFDIAVDFQGLLKSAVVASAAHAHEIVGFDCDTARECASGWFYSRKVSSRAANVV